MNEEKYIKGYNSGYILASHKPELLQIITQNLSLANDYTVGILSGKNQFEKERQSVQIQDIEKLRNHGKDRDINLEMG